MKTPKCYTWLESCGSHLSGGIKEKIFVSILQSVGFSRTLRTDIFLYTEKLSYEVYEAIPHTSWRYVKYIWGSIYDGWCADQQLRRQETDCKPAHCILLSPTLYCQSFLADTVPQYFLQPANVSLYHIRVYRVSSFFGRYISSIFTCPLYLIITHTLLPEFFWQIHFLQGGSFLHQCHCILLSHSGIQSIFIFWLIYISYRLGNY